MLVRCACLHMKIVVCAFPLESIRTNADRWSLFLSLFYFYIFGSNASMQLLTERIEDNETCGYQVVYISCLEFD